MEIERIKLLSSPFKGIGIIMWIPEKGSPMVEMFREAAGTNTEKVAAEFPGRARLQQLVRTQL